MKILCISIITLVLPMGAVGLSSTSRCGDPDDSCMDNENWKQCRNFELNGCQNIQILESCPLQFTCGDGKEKLPQEKENGNNLPPFVISPPHSSGTIADADEARNACVGLYVYNDSTCSGPPIRVLGFPTWEQPGSPCYHDATMHHVSVSDQYCNFQTGNWHETVFLGSNTCHKPHWWEWGKKYDLTFTTDSCINGIRLKGCVYGPCDSREIDLDDIRGRDAFSAKH